MAALLTASFVRRDRRSSAPLLPPRHVAADFGLVATGNSLLAVGARADGLVIAATAVAGIGLAISSAAATTEGTTVDEDHRGLASGIIKTAAQVGTALGTAVLLLIAATTVGIDEPGGPVALDSRPLAAASNLHASTVPDPHLEIRAA